MQLPDFSSIKNAFSNPADTIEKYLPDNPMSTFNFKVYILAACFGFSKITNIVEFTETDTIQEGGLNNHVHTLNKPTTQEKTLSMERGALIGPAPADKIFKLELGARITDDLQIFVYDRDGALGRVFEVAGAIVKRITYSDLDSMGSNAMIETFEIAYDTLKSVDITSFKK